MFEIDEIMPPETARQQSPLVLAYIGDSIYDVFVRTSLIKGSGGTVNTLHRASAKIVNAKAQADAAREIMDMLSDEEKGIFLRGRNAKSATVPKNMTVVDYRHATGLEALIGYLYLTGQSARLSQIMDRLLGIYENK